MTSEEMRALGPGDEVLVDVSAYAAPMTGLHWCQVEYVVAGSASPYPIRVRIPERGVGQYAPGEHRRRPFRPCPGEVIRPGGWKLPCTRPAGHGGNHE